MFLYNISNMYIKFCLNFNIENKIESQKATQEFKVNYFRIKLHSKELLKNKLVSNITI